MAKFRLHATGNASTSNGGWFQWVQDPGEAGVVSTFAGGEPATRPEAVIDLSNHASIVLGRQVPQSASFTIRGISVGFRATESGTNNESAGSFQGITSWYPVTQHGRKAMALARAVEKASEGFQMDSDSFFLSDEKDYSAMRLGWSRAADVAHQTVSAIAGIPEWTMAAVAAAYDTMTAPNEDNALFDGRFPEPNGLQWTANFDAGKTNMGNGGWLGHDDFQAEGLQHRVQNGLLWLGIAHSTMAGGEGTIQDDWLFRVSVDYEVRL
jgi:hypothetical protein